MTIPDQFAPQILIALEHYAAYMHATNRDPRPHREIAQQLCQPRGKSKARAKMSEERTFRMRLDL